MAESIFMSSSTLSEYILGLYYTLLPVIRVQMPLPPPIGQHIFYRIVQYFLNIVAHPYRPAIHWRSFQHIDNNGNGTKKIRQGKKL